MKSSGIRAFMRVVLVLVAAAQLAGCASTSMNYAGMDERECLARVMYFESQRSSADGMLAVGSVVMNRLESRRYPGSVCGVVGQRNQFAEGALTKPMVEGRSAALARTVANNVLSGQRHPGLAKNVMFFHTYGYHFPYTNMRYVLVAGGNIFYYKDNRRYATANNAQLLAYAPGPAQRTTPAMASDATAANQAAVNQAAANQPAAADQQAAASPQVAAYEGPVAGEQATDTPTPRAQPSGDAPAPTAESEGNAPPSEPPAAAESAQ